MSWANVNMPLIAAAVNWEAFDKMVASHLTIYLSGPMTGKPDYNRAEFATYAEKYRAMGYKVISPPELDVAIPGSECTWAKCIERDIKILLSGEVDRIYLLPNWHESKGAQVEVSLALGLGIPVWSAEFGRLYNPQIVANKLVNATLDGLAGTAATRKQWQEIQKDEVAGAPPGPNISAREILARRYGVTKDTNPKDAIGIAKAYTSTLPRPVLWEVGLALLEGALKYGRHNYRKAGVRGSVYFDAVNRHLDAWWEGQDIDPQSGIHHISKAIAGLMVIRDGQMNNLWEDDRPPAVKGDWIEKFNTAAKGLLEKYPAPARRAPFTNRENGPVEGMDAKQPR